MRGKLRFLIGIVVSAVFLYLALREVSFTGVKEAFSRFRPFFLAPAVAVFLFDYLVRGFRWQIIFSPFKRISFFASFSTLVMGFALNNVFPLRAGEILRAYLFGRRYKFSKSLTFGTIFTERVFDGLTLVFLTLLSSLLLALNEDLKKVIAFAILVFSGAVVVLLVAAFKKSLLLGLVGKLVDIFPGHLAQKVSGLTDSFLESFAVFRDSKVLFSTALLSLVVWFLEALSFYFISLGFGVNLGIANSIFLAGIVNLGILVPSSPGYIGVFEFFSLAVLVGLFSVNAETALSLTLIVHLLQYLSITLLGLAFFWEYGVPLFKIREETEV